MERRIHHLSSTTSTQAVARRLLAEGEADIGDVVTADSQTAGRGRFGRTWISPFGGLYATVICPADPRIALKAGLSVIRILQAASIPASIKWPNDILVDGKKLAGILIETIDTCALVGLGLNVLSSPLDTSTCLAVYVEPGDREQWVRTIADEMLASTDEPLDLEEYRRACITLGHRVRVEMSGGRTLVEGVAVDVDDTGRLVVSSTSGDLKISSGECLHIRPATGGS
jgi:BirA family transcriptional regulator, biotin operon repressor / biotin---[acetyl-CoA-carboxylase] ligase